MKIDAISPETIPDGQDIKRVSKEMESLFLYELLKTMRRTLSSERSLQEETYTSLFDLEFSRLLSERGTGIKEIIERQLMNRYPSVQTEPAIPLKGIITSKFGERIHPLRGLWSFHRGIDIAAPSGSSVKAIMDGRVLFSGYKEGYGNVVVIEHEGGIITRYAHNRINLVRENEVVRKGQVIAEVGSTGFSTGSHLHLEIIKDGKPVDPEGFLGIKDLKA